MPEIKISSPSSRSSKTSSLVSPGAKSYMSLKRQYEDLQSTSIELKQTLHNYDKFVLNLQEEIKNKEHALEDYKEDLVKYKGTNIFQTRTIENLKKLNEEKEDEERVNKEKIDICKDKIINLQNEADALNQNLEQKILLSNKYK